MQRANYMKDESYVTVTTTVLGELNQENSFIKRYLHVAEFQCD